MIEIESIREQKEHIISIIVDIVLSLECGATKQDKLEKDICNGLAVDILSEIRRLPEEVNISYSNVGYYILELEERARALCADEITGSHNCQTCCKIDELGAAMCEILPKKTNY